MVFDIFGGNILYQTAILLNAVILHRDFQLCDKKRKRDFFKSLFFVYLKAKEFRNMNINYAPNASIDSLHV